MVTLRSDRLTNRQEMINAPRQMCDTCRRLILWLPTCHATRMPFQPDPEPIHYDDGNGWAPGEFTVGGKPLWCFAPIRLHPPAKRRRIAHVMRLHHCRSVAA